MSEKWDRDLLDSIWEERMTLCYKMLLIRDMIDAADSNGRVSLREMAQAFQRFFLNRKSQGKAEDNPNRFKDGEPSLSERTITEWERTIRDEPVAHLHNVPIELEGAHLKWTSPHWEHWTSGFRRAIRNTAETRLIEYFDSNVPGGY